MSCSETSEYDDDDDDGTTERERVTSLDARKLNATLWLHAMQKGHEDSLALDWKTWQGTMDQLLQSH
jgi:hypothetical protein